MLARLIATFFGTGYLRPASGTWGSFAALPAAYGIIWATGPFVFALATIVVFLVGVWATGQVTAGSSEKDPSIIVIDEVAGQWLTLWPVAFGAASAGVALHVLWPGWVCAFFLFRLFDITKPWPANYFDRMKTPFGVMADDIVAGVYAALGVIFLAALYHVF
ncbi:MAG: phosphatidylglycerophosphatase A [Pseudomonadota bacterium]